MITTEFPTLTKESTFEVSPEEIAALFTNLGDDQQARFFNRVAEIVSGWQTANGFELQMLGAAKSHLIHTEGLAVMRTIGQSFTTHE